MMIEENTNCPQGFPLHLWEGFKLYVLHGVRPGDFMVGVLSGNLFEVFNRVDEDSLAGLRTVVNYLHNDCPAACYGDRENVKDWCLMGGLMGILEDQKDE